MVASVLAPTAFRWEHTTVLTALPYAALLTDAEVVRNLRVCPGETGRRVVAAWADALCDRGCTLAWLSEAEYACLCSREN
jgi:hypothetical protein